MKKGLLILFFVILSKYGAAQQTPYFVPKLLPESPTTSAVAKFGDYPVSLFSGVPEIAIPLHTIQIKGLEVPIVLRYHASGIKVTEMASWVGLGWALSCGGTISRKTMGRPDEGPFGYFFVPVRPTTDIDIADPDDVSYLTSVKNGNYDAQPDIFSYTFSGKSGKFFFNGLDDFKPTLIPYQPLEIVESLNANKLSFTIRDEQGNVHDFGKTIYETTHSSIAGNSSSSVTAWMLERSISADRQDTILFNYSSSFGQTLNDLIDRVEVEDNIRNYTIPPVYSQTLPRTYSSQVSVSTTEQKVSEIVFRGGKVVFELSSSDREDGYTGMKSLRSVKVYGDDHGQGQYRLLKTIHFHQSYFINGTDEMTKRLRLDSVSVSDVQDRWVYRFSYNTSVALPRRNSKARDYWDYYNGKPNSMLVPRMQIPYNSSSIWIGSDQPNSREPDANYMQAWTLNRIAYPAGGYTDFEFETNRYTELGVTKLAGGLRVKTIKSYDATGVSPVTKSYVYNAARPNFILSNYYFQTDQTYRYIITPSGGGNALGGTKRVRTYLSNPAIDIEPFDAVPVAYTKVTEYVGNANDNIGKTVYTFSDRPDALNTTAATGKPVITNYSFARGLLEEKIDSARLQGGGYKIVGADQRSYNVNPVYYNQIGLAVGKRNVNEGDVGFDANLPATGSVNDGNSWVYVGYPITSSFSNQTQKVNSKYDQNGSNPVTTVADYYYDNPAHQQVTRRAVTRSDGKKEITLTTYPPDYSNTGGFTGDMKANHLIAYPIEQVTYLESGSSRQLISGRITTYKAGGRGEKNQELVLETLEPVEGSAFKFSNRASAGVFPPAGSAAAFAPDWRYAVRLTYNSYDSRGNVRQYTLTDGPATSYLWDYQGMYPVAEVQNAAQTQIAYTSFEAEGKGNWSYAGAAVADGTAPTGHQVYALSGGSVSKGGLAASRSYLLTYWAKSGSAGSISGGAAEVVRSYNGWTQYRRKVSGVSAVPLSGTVRVDELRLHPMDASMRSFTYDPLVGMTSETDASGKLRYYQYDDFQRLETIRDLNGNLLEHYRYHYRTP